MRTLMLEIMCFTTPSIKPFFPFIDIFINNTNKEDNLHAQENDDQQDMELHPINHGIIPHFMLLSSALIIATSFSFASLSSASSHMLFQFFEQTEPQAKHTGNNFPH